MNIVLFEASELDSPIAPQDPRYRHITTVLRRETGDSFDAGVINGPRGKARIETHDDQGLRLRFDGSPIHSPPPPTTLIIGLPRPQTGRDILRDATTLGATTMHFVATHRSDPNYASSSLWQNHAWRRHVMEGAAQAFDTYTPEVTSARPLTAAVTSLPPGTRLLMLDNYGAATPLDHVRLPSSDTPVALCLGPERGWDDADRAQLAVAQAERVHLGERVLRLETAVTAALTLLNAIRCRRPS